ncbi:MAG: DUF262 domain-containing protein [Burkholderiales bacterium]|jgi:uncharacterized protein with ParB-like and HNH nuclease domain|nr:DUF262 domain-containing protein [Burkholderiales bacterium]
MSELQKKGIWSVAKLFNNEKQLMIPEYQRPYKWSINNVSQLINDIKRESEKDVSAYRLGTIVLHKEYEKDGANYWLNIVDGQQRTITLFLILKALKEIPTSNFNPNFTSEISKENIYNNNQFIEQNIATFDIQTINFLLNKCQVVFFILDDVSEAFQFFDSQNSRGKDLEPHDLLKAYHLREMADESEEIKTKAIENWENKNSNELANLFDEFLFKVKNWSRSRSARNFTKNEIYLFKGVNLNKNNSPHTSRLKMINYVVNRVEHYQPISYPFQLSEPIISGKGFFDFIHYYNEIYKHYRSNENSSLRMSKVSDKTTKIFDGLNNYKNQNRIGDEYVREMFDCAVLYYWDKFGENQLDLAIEKLFIWAYSLRLAQVRIGLPSTDNYAIGSAGQLQVFEIIRSAINHDEVINELLNFQVQAKRDGEDEDIRTLFEELNYNVQ